MEFATVHIIDFKRGVKRICKIVKSIIQEHLMTNLYMFLESVFY